MGLLLCLISPVGLGTLAIFATLAYGDGARPLRLLAVRFVVAAACFWPFAPVRGGEVRGPRRTRVLGALALGGLGFMILSVLLFAALQRLDVAPLSLVFRTHPPHR